MSFLRMNFHRYANLNPSKSNITLSTARFAKKKIDPFVEAKAKDEVEPENLNPLKPETLKEKIKNRIIRDFIPVAIGIGICSYMLYLLYKKRKESIQLDEMNKGQIYLEKERLDTLNNSNGNLNISRFIKLNKIKSFPNTFIQIINPNKINTNKTNPQNSLENKEPHLYYYKLNHILKRENIDLSLNYLNLNELKGNQLKNISKIFGVEEEEILNADFFISNKQGEFICYTDKNPKINFDYIKNFLIGIQKISNLKELKEIINSLTEETITILATESDKTNNLNSILNKIFINQASQFNMNTYNFLQMDFKSENFKIAENEIIVFLNRNIYEVNKDFVQLGNLKITENRDLEVEISFQKYFPNLGKFFDIHKSLNKEDFDGFENSEDNDTILFKEEMSVNQIDYKLEDDFLIALRLKFNNKSDSGLISNVEFLTEFLRSLIKIDNNLKNNTSTLFSDRENFRFICDNIIKRCNFTDNIDIAVFNKLNYFANRDKILILYLNQNNLITESRKELDNIRGELNRIIEKLKIDFPEIKFIYTSNPNIFNLFNLLPSNKENLSIRFLDYSRYSYFKKIFEEKNKFDNSIINIDKNSNLNEAIKDKDRNLIFNFKTNFSEYADTLNYDNLKSFVYESINLNVDNSNNKTKVKPYMECADESPVYMDKFNNNIKNLNSRNFRDEILSGRSFQSLVFLFNNDCIGCKKIEYLLGEFLDEKTDLKREINFYRYNTLNENVYFKKYRNVPAAVLFENGKIVKEIDFKKVIEDNQNHDNAIKEVFESIVCNNRLL